MDEEQERGRALSRRLLPRKRGSAQIIWRDQYDALPFTYLFGAILVGKSEAG
jgi:hypothetical protein